MSELCAGVPAQMRPLVRTEMSTTSVPDATIAPDERACSAELHALGVVKIYGLEAHRQRRSSGGPRSDEEPRWCS